MDFDQLITFLEVAKQGSFSRAGEKVFRSQSAVSAQIRQLEQEYGDRLLDRSGKTVKLTPAGQVLFELRKQDGRLLTYWKTLQPKYQPDDKKTGAIAFVPKEKWGFEPTDETKHPPVQQNRHD